MRLLRPKHSAIYILSLLLPLVPALNATQPPNDETPRALIFGVDNHQAPFLAYINPTNKSLPDIIEELQSNFLTPNTTITALGYISNKKYQSVDLANFSPQQLQDHPIDHSTIKVWDTIRSDTPPSLYNYKEIQKSLPQAFKGTKYDDFENELSKMRLVELFENIYKTKIEGIPFNNKRYKYFDEKHDEWVKAGREQRYKSRKEKLIALHEKYTEYQDLAATNDAKKATLNPTHISLLSCLFLLTTAALFGLWLHMSLENFLTPKQPSLPAPQVLILKKIPTQPTIS